MTEHHPHQITKFIDGPFTDYIPQWYLFVGNQIVSTMLIEAFMPLSDLAVAFVTPLVMQRLDNKNTGDPYQTKSTSMHAFKSAYGGADFSIQFKYSNALNVVYITMMYGLGMPILFPLAAINLSLKWATERIIVAYFSK